MSTPDTDRPSPPSNDRRPRRQCRWTLTNTATTRTLTTTEHTLHLEKPRTTPQPDATQTTTGEESTTMSVHLFTPQPSATTPVGRRRVRTLLQALAVGAASAAAVLSGAAGQASAAPTGITATGCADAEVVFARGTFEGPGVGKVGTPFVDALRTRLPGHDVAVYAVNYPASMDFARAADGVADVATHLNDMATRCPTTDIVLGGYSQGAAVTAYATSDTVPAGYALPAGLSGPLSPSVANNVAAVALFGKPSAGIVNLLQQGAPPIVIGSAFAGKTIELCAPEDPVCQFGSLNRAAHSAYVTNGMADHAADFAAAQITARRRS
jgi:cutinase